MSTAWRECLFFFFNDTATTEIYTLSLHDALPISQMAATWDALQQDLASLSSNSQHSVAGHSEIGRATSELQSQSNLVCRLLLEKKKAKPAPRASADTVS